jgi:hypothetical protein
MAIPVQGYLHLLIQYTFGYQDFLPHFTDYSQKLYKVRESQPLIGKGEKPDLGFNS